MKTTYNLKEDQFLSDVAKDLPTTNGIHLHIAPTGCGKTFHMMHHAHDTNGIVVFPVKAIKEQQQLTQEKDGTVNALIQQIEHLPDVGEAILFDGNSLHVDEAQILYLGGFRRSVEKLIHLIKEASKVMPVHLYSATIRPELLPIKVDTINFIDKPFTREINVIQIPKKSEIKGCPIWIATALKEILSFADSDQSEMESDLPMLCFLNSYKMMKTVKAQLEKHGYNDVIIIDSKRTSLDEEGIPLYPEAHKIYKRVLKYGAMQTCGKRIILATDCMSEGINIFDKFHVVSVQVEAGKVFQQQGRARCDAYHWLITGDGTDQLKIINGQLHRFTCDDGNSFSFELKEESKLTDIKCDWLDEQASRKASLAALLMKHFQKGCYGMQVVKDLEVYGYKAASHFDLTEVVKNRVKRIEVGKQTIIKHIAIHGCPMWLDHDSNLFLALKEQYAVEEFDRQFSLAVDWNSTYAELKQQGIKLDVWEVYQRVNTLGRGWLQWVFASRETFDTTIKDVDSFREFLIQEIGTTKTEVQDHAKGCKGGRLTGEEVDNLSNLFWSEVMPEETEFNWWTDDNSRMRSTLFKLLMGFVVDDANNWSLPADRPEWCLPLTNNERKAYSRRESHITKAGMTVEEFCLTTGNTTKSIALLKTKEVKTLVNSITF
ncbi:TPA: hypothetical protein ACX6S2_001216 [Photobacterium damselae]